MVKFEDIKIYSIVKIFDTDKILEICADLGVNFKRELYLYEKFHGKEVIIDKIKPNWHIKSIDKSFNNYKCKLEGLGTQFIPSVYIEKIIKR